MQRMTFLGVWEECSAAADKIVITATPDLASLRNTKNLLDTQTSVVDAAHDVVAALRRQPEAHDKRQRRCLEFCL